MYYLWLIPAIGLVGFLLYRAGRVWVDAGQWHPPLASRLWWSLLGAFAPAHYRWGVRVQAMTPGQRADLLAHETRVLKLSRADAMCCPLTETEIPRAWALTAEGRPIVARSRIQCPECDFRLDSCRHCTHFLPGSPRDWGQEGLGGQDITYGRCQIYKAMQPVDQVYAPHVACRLKAQGYEQIRAPLLITDSYFPPDYCTSFEPHLKRLRSAGIPWPDARRVALLRLLAAEEAVDESH
jgi:hypothetical protein